MLLAGYLTALGLTLAVEVPLYTAVLIWGWRVRWQRALATAVGVNLVTHPPLWWLLVPLTVRPSYPWIMVVAEAVVALAEWLLLAAWVRRRDPLLLVLSVGVNAASVLAGLIFAIA
jgi:hypothetical protein